MINNRQAGRRRGRNNSRPQGNGRGGDSGNRIDNRARGNAAQLLEKYKNLARDAQTQGDRVNTEYYLQFADHYFRVLADNRSRQEEQQGWRRNRDDNRFDGDGEGEDEAESDTEMVQGVGDRFRTQDAGEEGDRPQRQNQREPRRARRNHEETEAAEQAQVPEEIAEQSQAHDTDEAAPKPKRAPRARRAPKSEAVADESHTMDAAILPPSISRADNDSGEEESPTPRKRTRRTRPATEAAE